MSLNPVQRSAPALAADAKALDRLKLQAAQNTPAAIRETAKQFESLFMRELLKSMREATLKSGLLDNPGSDLGTDLLDQQFAVQMSGQPGGLSDLIAAQLARQMGIALEATPTPGAAAATPTARQQGGRALGKTQSLAAYRGVDGITPKATAKQAAFVQRHTDAAMRIERETGIPASFMIGQAGHETGWGQSEIRMRGGQPAYNLFGIKADASWKGKVAEVTTTEYVNGVAQKKVAKFRAYDSYDESFRDYARLITQSPRYAKVAQHSGSAVAFANSLQQAGYATDPQYAAKLSRAIETTQRLQQSTPLLAHNV
ncbi:MAG: flagellar assembly peptidoglycan hydrolase FlgJ [Rhodoferax sp.]